MLKVKNSNNDIYSLLEPVVLSLKLLSFWSDVDKNSIFNSIWYKLYRTLMASILVLFLISGLLYIFFKRNTLTVEDVTSVLFCYITTMVNYIMVICIVLNKKTLFKLIAQLKSEQFKPKVTEHYRIVDRAKLTSRRLLNFYIFEILLLMFSTAGMAYFKSDSNVVAAYIPNWFPDRLFLIYQLIAINFNVSICATYILLNSNLMIQAGVEVDILKNLLETVDTHENLIECLMHHREIIIFAKGIEQIVKIGMLINFISNVVILSTTIYTVKQATMSDLAFLIPYLSGCVSIVYLHCWFGNELMYKSEGLSTSIFISSWLDRDVSYKKLIIQFMMFTKQPIRIRLAGGLFSLSLPVCIAIFRSAYSYYTILQSFNSEET